MEISETKEFAKLSDIEVEIEKCMEAWEAIVKRNSELTGGVGFKTYLDNYRTYAQLLADFNAIKATLSILVFKVDDEYIAWLRTRGYKIVTDKGNTVEERSAAYAESINAAMSRSENLITKIRMKLNELAEENKSRESGADKPFGFEELMANLSMSLGFEVNDNLTLARFNELNKLIAKRNKEANKR